LRCGGYYTIEGNSAVIETAPGITALTQAVADLSATGPLPPLRVEILQNEVLCAACFERGKKE
jgi:hypothetical protein